MSEVKAEQVVAAYIATRDEISEIKERHKEELAERVALQEKRAQWLHQQLNDAGSDSVKIKGVGTFFKKKNEFLSVADLEEFHSYIKEHDAWDLLTKAVNKTAALERMGEDRDVTKVPGLKYTTETEVQVRRS